MVSRYLLQEGVLPSREVERPKSLDLWTEESSEQYLKRHFLGVWVSYCYPPPESHFPNGASGKEPACQCRRHKRHRFSPWIGKISWRREWQPTPVFLLGKSHGQRTLAGYSPWGHKRVGNDLAAKTTRASPIGQSAVQMHQDVPVGL